MIPHMQEQIRRVLAGAVERHEIPGAVGLVQWRGRGVFHEAFGHACLEPEKVEMRPDHVFDLASLTKVVATATAILILRDEGRLDLDDPVSRHLPEWNVDDKRSITIRQLLTHTSGLPAYRQYYKTMQGKEAYRRAIAAEKLAHPPGTHAEYSDLGFITLGFVIERVSGKTIGEFTRERIFAPLGMEHTRYYGKENPEATARVFAATEFCPWRKELALGIVHDENAWAIGGDSGHAGLFSTAEDLSRFGQMLLRKGEWNGAQILAPESVLELNAAQTPALDPQRGLGWKIRPEIGSKLGFLPGAHSFGHTGFTGVTLWIDPDNQIVAVLLTNAIHPSRDKADTAPARIGFHKAIADAVNASKPPQVKTGLDVLEGEGFERLRGKRVALTTNHSAINAKGERLLDLLGKSGIRVTAIFGPEHGFLGSWIAGEKIGDSVSGAIPVYSLYGERRKPAPEMAGDFDVMLYDIQDVGVRFYTYVWTLFSVQQFCAEHGRKLIVLDRPDPIGGHIVEGPVLEERFASFVGLKPVPIRYGLTPGEMALLFNQQGWLGHGRQAELEVVKMEGWRRDMWFDDAGAPWVNPSPNIRTLDTAVVYPGTCLLEGANWSEGRGTLHPFELVGAPDVDAETLSRALNDLRLPGCRFLPAHFTPKPIEGLVDKPKHNGERCGGVFIRVDDRETFRPVKTAVAILLTAKRLFPETLRWRAASFDRLAGSDRVRERIDAGDDLEEIVNSWENELQGFEEARKGVMLY
ncbi:MAG: DUF1343 domain-containing protein [Candidatus Sumerlaeota bacterium]|nr:DUF1343 domain-containing protein [Candidatus Sumerlaeota bacterium]